MDKSNILIIALLALIFIGFLHSRVYEPTTTSKTVVVKEDPYYRRYGYRPPPPHYNRYKAQYYN
jgi:meiotically up-regulated gene 157 (Mug157) protein